MKSELITRLTNEYKQAIELEWSILHANGVEIQLQNPYIVVEEERTNSQKKIELSVALRKSQHLVLLGEPGSGKSTVLQFIGLCFVHDTWYKTKLKSEIEYVPVKINLRGCASLLAEPGPMMEQIISRTIREFLRRVNEDDAKELVKVWQDQGNLLVLLDGLDEVPENLRGEVSEEINRFVSAPQASKCQIIVSSRATSYLSLGTSFKNFIVKPFENREDTKPYLVSWLGAIKPEWSYEQAIIEADNLFEQMNKQPALHRFLNNPLILRLSAQVFARDNEIASNRANLYQSYLADLWDRAKKRGADPNLGSQIMACSEELAWQLQTNIEPNIPNEILAIMHEKMGLVIPAGDNFVFNHMTLQEYFVGQRLIKAWQTNRARAWQFLHPRLHIQGWREPILLMGGGLSQADSDDLSRKIYSAKSALESSLHRDKILITVLANEGIQINQSILNKILQRVRLANSKWGKFIFGNIGFIELNNLVEGIGYFGKPSIPVLYELLNNEEDLIQSKAIDVLVKIGAREAIPVLLNLYKNTHNYFIRLRSLNALAEFKEKSLIPDMIGYVGSGDSTMGSGGARALATLKSVETIPILIQLLDNDNINNNSFNTFEITIDVVEALSGMGPIVIPYIRQALKHKNGQIRCLGIKTLEKINTSEVVSDIKEMLKDGNAVVREEAIEALTNLNEMDASPDLRRILINDEIEWVRGSAAGALGRLKSEDAIPELELALKDSSDQVREAANRALKEMGYTKLIDYVTPKKMIPIAFKAFREYYPNGAYDPQSLKVLDEARQDSINYLLTVLQNQADVQGRWAAVTVLGQLNAREVIPELMKVLSDENKYVRRIAVETLGILNAHEAIPELRNALKDKEINVAAAIALGKMGEFEVIPYLRQNIKKKKSQGMNHEYWILKDLIANLPVFHSKNEKVFYIRELQALKRVGFEKEIVIERLEALEVSNLSNQDPFEPIKLSQCQMLIRGIFISSTIVIILILLAVAVTVFGATQDVFMGLFGQTIINWVSSNPMKAVTIFIFLGLLVGFLPWLIEGLRDKLTNK